MYYLFDCILDNLKTFLFAHFLISLLSKMLDFLIKEGKEYLFCYNQRNTCLESIVIIFQRSNVLSQVLDFSSKIPKSCFCLRINFVLVFFKSICIKMQSAKSK